CAAYVRRRYYGAVRGAAPVLAGLQDAVFRPGGGQRPLPCSQGNSQSRGGSGALLRNARRRGVRRAFPAEGSRVGGRFVDDSGEEYLVAVGCWLLAVGCWLLAVGCWLLAVGRWLFAFGRWSLAVLFWSLAVGC